MLPDNAIFEPTESVAGSTTPPLPAGRAILILGMHRSGTSALARVLNLMGVELGEDLLPPASDNESGFWEHRQIQFIHDRIYEVLKLDWTNVSPLADRWWELPEIEPYREQLRAILRRDFGNRPLWGIKDPRLCAMLALWRPLLAEMNVQPACVLICRNPAEVSQSLGKRDQLTSARVYLLWLRSIIDAERGSRGLPRTISTFEQILNDWGPQVDRMAVKLDQTWPRSTAEVAREVSEFLRPSSRHHHVDDGAFLNQPDIPPIVLRMHAAVLKASQSGDLNELSNVVDTTARELDHSLPLLSDFIADLEQEHRNSVIRTNVESLRINAEIALRDQSAAACAADATAKAQQIAALQVRAAEQEAALLAERDKAVQQAAVAAEDRQTAEATITDLQAQVSNTVSQLANADARNSELQQQAVKFQEQIEHQTTALTETNANFDRTKVELAQYQIQRMILLNVVTKIQATRSWRWTAMLRWWRRPLTQEDLLPVSDIRQLANNRWACNGVAHFALPCVPIRGRIRIELRIDASVAGRARLYFDTGSLFNPQEVLDLGDVQNETVICRETNLDKPVHCFRLDPLDVTGEFTISHFRILCIST